MKCCICGTVRNCEKYLQNVFNNMEKIATLFDEYVILLYYDNSDDNTLQIIQNYQKINNHLVYHINTDPIIFSWNTRTFNIAKGRNWCINTIKCFYSNYDYFIMMDCDDVCSNDINIDVLSKSLLRDDWDSLSFNRKNYYDLWALSIYPYIHSCLHFNIGQFNGVDITKRNFNQILSKTSKNSLIKCYSAFCGFAIYKTNKFLNCNYDSKCRLDLLPNDVLEKYLNLVKNITNSLHVDCEHRSFHYEAIKLNNARIRISPEFLF